MINRFVIVFCLAATPAIADAWRHYANARFGYAVDLPGDFTVTSRADNGDGMTLQSSDRTAELRVFGTNRLEEDFAAELKSRVEIDKKDGWTISYSKPSKTSASYSGTRKDRILYVRAIALCHDAVGYFTLEYPKAALKPYDPIVQRLVKTLSALPRCKCSKAGRTHAEAGEDRRIMDRGGRDDKAVPDRILEAQLFPDVEDHSE
jgi:hypothetical protein